MSMSRPEILRCFLEGCNQRVLPNSVYCSLLHASDAVRRGEADACVYCKQFAKTPGFPTCSKACGGLLALSRRSSGTNTTNYQPRSYSYSTPSTTAGPKVPSKDNGGKRSFKYPCGCTIMTHVANPPAVCPICQSSAPTGRATPTTASDSGPHRNADPFQDPAESARALVDTRHPTAGGFKPSTDSKYKSIQPPATKGATPKDMDPLAISDDEAGYATPDVALSDSPVVETTSGSDSAVLVNYSEESRSDTMMSGPPAYDDMEWTTIEAPSGRSSPVKEPRSSSPVPQKRAPEVPPRPRGLAGRTMTSSKSSRVSTNPGQESVSSAPAWRRVAPESTGTTPGPLGRRQNSKDSPLSPSDQPGASSMPIFPSAPTNALGISEAADTPGNPLIIADPKVGGNSDGLSNQDPFPIEYKKKKYPSGEHLYHAMKFMDTRPLLAEHIRECGDPKGEAARFRFEQNPGWDQMRLQKMEEVIQLKCKQHSTFKDKLRETGDTHIYFNDPDPFWGTGADGSGQNHFGEVLMKVRATVGEKGLIKRL